MASTAPGTFIPSHRACGGSHRAAVEAGLAWSAARRSSLARSARWARGAGGGVQAGKKLARTALLQSRRQRVPGAQIATREAAHSIQGHLQHTGLALCCSGVTLQSIAPLPSVYCPSGQGEHEALPANLAKVFKSQACMGVGSPFLVSRCTAVAGLFASFKPFHTYRAAAGARLRSFASRTGAAEQSARRGCKRPRPAWLAGWRCIRGAQK